MAPPSDPLYAKQWHLPMIGNLQRVWNDYTGAGVTVAVYDDGLEYDHPDLAANYDRARHFRFEGTTYDPMPLGSGDAHGTACAGLIGAVADNGRGGVGVAHGVTITGMNYLNDLQNAYDWENQQTTPLYDAALRWAAGFDIMSNSWGTDPDYSDELNLNLPGNASAVDAVHFEWISANGRGGLGTIIVKAAGNDTLNANGDGANTSRHTITVAAVERGGFVADYSNFGSSLLISGPAAAYTTDLTGNQGYNNGNAYDGDPLGDTDYTSVFNGTSAATPVVAGVVALMLEAAPGLGWRDVQAILATSARHTGAAFGAGASGYEVAPWQSMGGGHWNGGGAIYSQSYGFGLVDAYAAVRMAEVWSRLQGAARTSANERHLRAETDGLAIPLPDTDGNDRTPELKISLDVAGNIEIDSVQVTFTLRHSYPADLQAYLRSPTGERVMMFSQDMFDETIRWTFAAEAFRGMDARGTWTIEFHDEARGDSGRILNARLDFYGSVNSAGDVYHFTDDFRALSNVEADRRVIDDGNGGVDWLNLAAMTGNVAVAMGAGGAIRVNGTLLASLASGAADFENLQAGDGADRLFGNVLANRIFAGRGNDVLNGGQRADRLFGERGNDTLVGGGGADVLTGGDGRDTFRFNAGFGKDRVTDWADGTDRLALDDALWGGGQTAQEVVETYGAIVAGSAVLTFAGNAVLTLSGVGSLDGLANDIVII